jgi:predicted metalloprotease
MLARNRWTAFDPDPTCGPGKHCSAATEREADRLDGHNHLGYLRSTGWKQWESVMRSVCIAILTLAASSAWSQGNPDGAAPQPPKPGCQGPGSLRDDTRGFVARVLGSTEAQWKAIFAEGGTTYQPPILVLCVRTLADSGAFRAVGPSYSLSDKRVYLDTASFGEIESRFHGCQGKACQFSQAYVIGHEVGHHVQNLLGVLPKVRQQQQQLDKVNANRLQVRVELQADCLAGVWANRQNQQLKREGKPPFIEPGDVEAAMQTASAIGDDSLQRQATGQVMPDSFTHGSSAQRQRWLMTGLKEGNIAACNTFRSDDI